MERDELSVQSAFDWGLGPKENGGGTESGNTETSSRYDPKAMSRIVDITDLVDDSDSEEIDDEYNVEMASKDISSSNDLDHKNGQSRKFRRGLTIAVLFVAIVAGVVGISFSVLAGKNRIVSTSASEPSDRELLLIAERVVVACSEDQLNNSLTDCQNVCHNMMCCFAKDENNCANDPTKFCAAHAGCEALMNDIPESGDSTSDLSISGP